MTAVPAGPVRRADVPGANPGRDAPAGRFRDWNPDLRVARELGVHIEYSSMRNEVRCPELKLTSRDRERATGMAPRMTVHGVSYGPAVSVGGDSAGGSGSSTASRLDGVLFERPVRARLDLVGGQRVQGRKRRREDQKLNPGTRIIVRRISGSLRATSSLATSFL